MKVLKVSSQLMVRIVNKEMNKNTLNIWLINIRNKVMLNMNYVKTNKRTLIKINISPLTISDIHIYL